MAELAILRLRRCGAAFSVRSLAADRDENRGSGAYLTCGGAIQPFGLNALLSGAPDSGRTGATLRLQIDSAQTGKVREIIQSAGGREIIA